MIFKKFYDVLAPEGGVDIAAIMAKSGVVSNPDRQVEVPKINTTEKKEEAPSAPAAPAPATAAKPAEQSNPESPKPTTEPQAAKPQTEEAPKVTAWQEVLKQQQPDTILSELGYSKELADFLKENKELDPKMVGFLRHWKSNGELKPYLEALSTDYAKMAPEEVMKHQLRLQNPELDGKQLDRLFKVKVMERYKLDPQLYTEDEVEDGRIELMADVKSIRQQLAQEQNNYLFPKPPEPTAKDAEPDLREQQRQQEAQAYKSFIQDHSYTKDLLSNKQLSVGQGEDKFDFPVDPNAILEVLYNPDVWAEQMFLKETKPDGSIINTPDARKQILMAGIAKYGDDFLIAYASHFKSLGGRAALAQIENAKPPDAGSQSKAPVEETTNPAAAMAKRGRVTRGGE